MNQDEARQTAAAMLYGCTKIPSLSHGTLVNISDAIEAIAAALVKLTEGQEVVGYANSNDIEQMRKYGGGVLLWSSTHAHDDDAIPLYTLPAPSQQEERKPLVDCGMCRTQGCYEGECRHGIKEQK